jgi:hypothetical protein
MKNLYFIICPSLLIHHITCLMKEQWPYGISIQASMGVITHWMVEFQVQYKGLFPLGYHDHKFLVIDLIPLYVMHWLKCRVVIPKLNKPLNHWTMTHVILHYGNIGSFLKFLTIFSCVIFYQSIPKVPNVN